MLTADFFFVLLYAFSEAYSDAAAIKLGQPIDHKKGGLERFTAMVGFAFLSHWRLLQAQTLFSGDQFLVLLCVVAIFVAQLMFFWIVFDLMLNLVRGGLSAFYVGQDKRTAWIDKMAKKILGNNKATGPVLFGIKVAACVVSIIFYNFARHAMY